MSSLQAFPHNGNLVVDSRSIAMDLGIQHRNLLVTIEKHLSVIQERFGQVAFETQTVVNSVGAVNESRIAYLTEAQATFVGTLSRNTDRVIAFKANLVQAFMAAKERFQTPSVSKQTLALPPHLEALEVAKSVRQIHDELSDIDPRLSQILIDRAMQTVQPLLASATQPEVKLSGCVEIAESLGFSVGKEQSTLGKAVAKAWRDAYGAEPQQLKRECGGAMRSLKVYPGDDPVIAATIREFYGERVE